MFALALIWAIALGLVSISVAQAQGAEVRIVELGCAADPELVAIQNLGSDAQDLTDWELQSDPASEEFFPLSKIGVLPPGGSIFIESGSAASGTFVWSQEFVFRDGDPTDYARIVDDTGDVVHEVNCADGAEPSPTASPELTPAPSPIAEVPNGGGSPPPSDASLSPALMMAIGGSLLASALATFALPWLPRAPSARPMEAVSPHAPLGPAAGAPGWTLYAFAVAVLVALAILLTAGRPWRQ